MIDDNIISKLEQVGLDKKHAKVYLTTLESGGTTASEIARKSGEERVNTYYLLGQLVKKGLVYTATNKSGRLYIAHSPKKLIAMAKNRVEQIEGIIPELLSFESTNAQRPKIKFYEGVDGIKEVFNETLDLPKGSETLAFASYSVIAEHLKDFVPDFISRRAAKGITQRIIVVDDPRAREELLKNDKQDLRETRLVPKEQFPFEADQINIFSNKMFIASYVDMLALVIESKTVVNSFRAIFELAWLGAGQVETLKL